jgi:amino acid transporter
VIARVASRTSHIPIRGSHALGFPTLLAQSVALISPTMTAVLIIALAFADAGQGTWAAYLFGTIMLLFVVLGLNQFAKRSATAGSMYAYTAKGLGRLRACCRDGADLVLLGHRHRRARGLCDLRAGIPVGDRRARHRQPVDLLPISGFTCLTIAWKDIRISSLLTLALEALSVTIILALAAVVLFKHGCPSTPPSSSSRAFSLEGMDFAIVICIFSLVGFESATTLGSEAKRPLRNVPRAVIWSLLITGAFMVFMSYVEVFATKHMGKSLSSLHHPADRDLRRPTASPSSRCRWRSARW